MDQNFSLMAQSRANYYTAGSPVQFVRVELLKGDVTGEVAVCLTFKNVGTEPLTGLVKNFYNNGGKIAAICAAPTVFAEIGLLHGKKATAYPACMDGLGDAVKSEEKVVIDGNITTSRGLGTAIDFSLSLISQLLGQEKADQIAESVVYK